MTEQTVETEQEFLGNVSPDKLREAARYGVPVQHYSPNAHRGPKLLVPTLAEADLAEALARHKDAVFALPAAEATFTRPTDLWLDAEEQATRALAEIQDGNINAGIACLQSALAFAQNHRHSLTEEAAR